MKCDMLHQAEKVVEALWGDFDDLSHWEAGRRRGAGGFKYNRRL
jgi:hypothetical protein